MDLHLSILMPALNMPLFRQNIEGLLSRPQSSGGMRCTGGSSMLFFSPAHHARSRCPLRAAQLACCGLHKFAEPPALRSCSPLIFHTSSRSRHTHITQADRAESKPGISSLQVVCPPTCRLAAPCP